MENENTEEGQTESGSSPEPENQSEKNKKRILVAITIVITVFICLVIVLSGILFILNVEEKNNITPKIVDSVENESSVEEILDPVEKESLVENELDKVYSVEEISQILKENPGFLENKSIKIKAYIADGVAGMGCDDFFMLTDFEEGMLYDSQYDDGLTQDERNEIQKKIRDIPIITTGPTLDLRGGDFYPTVYAIYEGHFYDEWAMEEECLNGSKKFVIDRKVEEIVPNKNLTSLSKTIYSGCIIENGRPIFNPLEVTLKDAAIRINGVLYEPSIEDEVDRITLKTNDERVSQYDILVRNLEKSTMIIYGGNRYQSEVGNCSFGKLLAIDEIVKSNESITQKKKKLEEIIGYIGSEDIFANWKLDRELFYHCPRTEDLFVGDRINCRVPTKVTRDYCLDGYKHWITINCGNIEFIE